MPWDYPRVCGGTSGNTATGGYDAGLSPRVRGNLITNGSAESAWRTIPACAGEPARKRRHRLPIEDYPRVCGGTPSVGVRQLETQGLSPRVRGNLPILQPVRLIYGTIPACAGEPGVNGIYA